MAMKKIIKAVAFVLIFCLLFLGVQEVLRYKFDKNENSVKRYEAYLEEKEDSIDVFFIGSSPVNRGVVPMILWEEAGFTSFNFGTSSNNALVCYYQFLYALETQTPKLVVIDFCSLFEDRKPSDEVRFEPSYRKITDAIPSLRFKAEMVLQIKKDNPEQDMLSYFFPILRYHSRWIEITENDFAGLPDYDEFSKGTNLVKRSLKEEIDYDPNFFDKDVKNAEISEYSWGYYKKIIDLCTEKNIPLVAVSFPRTTTKTMMRRYKTITQVCDEYDLNYYNLNAPEMWEKYGYIANSDFYDYAHMNANGAVKISKALAEMLSADYDLPDHRGDKEYDAWDEDWNAFYEKYEDILTKFDY